MKKRLFFTALVAGLLSIEGVSAQDLTLLQYRLPRMHCEHCAARVRNAINLNEGIDRVDIDLEKQVASIKYDAGKTTPEAISASLTEANYPPESYSPTDVISKELAYLAVDMKDAATANKVASGIKAHEGILDVTADETNHTVNITYDANKTTSDYFKEYLRELGFTASGYYTGELAQYARFKALSGAMDEDAEIDLYNEVEGIVDITLNENTNEVAVTYHKNYFDSIAAVKQAIEAQGYKLEVID